MTPRGLARLRLLNTRKRRRNAVIVSGVVVVILAVVWFNRWRLSRTAVNVADPLVRAWVTGHVLDASDSVYHLTASPIKVNDSTRRISIDTITLTTDSVRNSKLPQPHTQLTLRFANCAVTGIDLASLAGGAGLHANHAGCDSVTLLARTPIPTPDATDTASAPVGADSNNFLRFQGKLDLPKALPFIGIDTVAFPHVHVALDLASPTGARTTLTFDSVAVHLDSLRVDPKQPVAQRRPLFSRDVIVDVDRFDGTTFADAHLSLQHLRLGLNDGTLRMDSMRYQPAAARVDSTGFSLLAARHLLIDGANFRDFLLHGNIALGRVLLDTAMIRTVSPVKPKGAHPPKAIGGIGASLRATGRDIRVDDLKLRHVTVIQTTRPRSDSSSIVVGEVAISRLNLHNTDAGWKRALPLGPVHLVVSHLFRHTTKMDIALARLDVDAGAQRMTLDSLHAAPQGDDSAFERRNPYRKARLSVTMAQIAANGIDFTAWLERGALRTRALDVHGMAIDVMKDKSKPDDPAPNVIRRYPQQVMRDAGVEIQIDTLTGDGVVTYRERQPGAPTAGILTFGSIKLRGYNFSTDPTRMSAATPFRLIGDSKLMNAGPMHVEWDVPLLAATFEMTWHGSLGEMDPTAMNAFLPNSVGMKFTGGDFRGATWDATVHDGLSRGKLTPRWHGLSIGLPGVARTDSGFIGGLLRGVAKIAANTFGIRSDNDTIGGDRPLDASITHRWVAIETLPQFIWFQLRDPLLLVLKK